MTSPVSGRNKPAREYLAELLQPYFPKRGRWQLVLDETAKADADRTRVRIVQRSIEPARGGDARAHTVTLRVTVTVPTDSLESAEAQLDDDMTAFLYGLDLANIGWSKADKARFEDENNRLGYSLDVELITTPNEEM